MNKRLPKHAEDRLRALYEKLDACDGKLMETIRRRDLERKNVNELEYAARLRAQEPGQVRDADLEVKFDERLNRARESLARLNQRYNEIGTEKMPLIRLKERCETYVLNAGFLLPDDDHGLVRGRAVPRGVNETIII